LNGILTSEEFDSPQYDLILDLLFSDYLNIHKESINRRYIMGEGEFK